MRGNFVWAFIGASGTGKTVTAVQLAKQWKRAKKKLGGKIFAFDPHDAFDKVSDVKITVNDEDWAKIMTQRHSDGSFMFRHSLLILDDYRSILPSDKMDRNFYDLLALRRKLDLDIIYITHNPRLIIQGLVYWNTHFSIFRTEAMSDDFAEKIPKFLICQQACNLINAYCKTYHATDYESLYPNFPHIMVKNDSDILYMINMDDNKIKSLKLA